MKGSTRAHRLCSISTIATSLHFTSLHSFPFRTPLRQLEHHFRYGRSHTLLSRLHPSSLFFSPTQKPALVGHSFGGATILQLLNDERSSWSEREGAKNVKNESEFCAVIVMDAWTFPVSDDTIEQAITAPVSVRWTMDGLDVFVGGRGGGRDEVLGGSYGTIAYRWICLSVYMLCHRSLLGTGSSRRALKLKGHRAGTVSKHCCDCSGGEYLEVRIFRSRNSPVSSNARASLRRRSIGLACPSGQPYDVHSLWNMTK